MRKRYAVLAVVAAPAAAVLISACTQATPHSNLTVQCAEILTGTDITDGSVSGTGHCTITGLLHDSGPATDYRTLRGETAFIRRVVVGAKGTITFVIKIPLTSGTGEPWRITSGTRTYTKLRGRGYQVVDNYTGTPATFVLKGTVAQAGA